MRKVHLALLASTAAALVLTACQNSNRRQELAYVERPVELLYSRATEELDNRDYDQAILLFNEVERQHPYSEWARRSSLMAAFASYESRNYDEAISTSQRYLSLNPAGQGASYAYYLIAVSYFDQIIDVGRDQKTTELARDALRDVIRRYPETDYARDATVKLDMVQDQLAGKEMEIGRWYLRRNQHLSAINRFRTVVSDYDTTSHTPEALHRLVEVYLATGLKQEALAAGAVLGYNYPESIWYRYSYRLLSGQGLDPEGATETQKRTWLERLIPGGK
ncbi:MAG: outer membrane protein assembly factor BamD [Hyphomonadaceae bacterium]|nr:outer membrane protein assembly factor BamD [Hyphomonadaceae bacterium]